MCAVRVNRLTPPKPPLPGRSTPSVTGSTNPTEREGQMESTTSNDGVPTAAELDERWGRVVGRRGFLVGVGAAGAAALASGGLATAGTAFASGGRLSSGDAAILRFLAAAEIIETDLWQQYTELGGVNGGNPAYIAALENLDGDMPQYISDNTDDEHSHDAFRTLPSSKATGAKQIGRLTNLMNLNVDTSWYTRYRSGKNPDFGATFPQAVHIQGEPAIPVSDADTPPGMSQPVPPTTPQQRRMQAIANTAGFHFAMIEQGGSSLYTTMSLKATDLEVLRIIVSIGGTEV